MKVLRAFITRTEEHTWKVRFEDESVVSIEHELDHLTDVDEAIDIAAQVYEARRGEKLNVLRFIDMDVDSFGNTQF
jgi:hypothetical protein